jgi:hypothetical protein
MTRRATIAAYLLLGSIAEPATAHGYKFGPIEVLHPSIVETAAGDTSSCAHLLIRNTGPMTEYFLGARIESAADMRLMRVEADGHLVPAPARIVIPPGGIIDLHHDWCLLATGLSHRLEADVGMEKGALLFETAGLIEIEFMIDYRPAD